MSPKCDICEKTFIYPYLLHRHQNKKIPCKMNQNVQNELNNRVNNLEDKVEQLQENIRQDRKDIVTPTLNSYKCTHCFETFTRADNLTRHINQKRCRGKTDNIEIYEKELGIVKLESIPLTCRFCHVTFSKQQSYSRHKTKGCSKKKDYECDLKNQVLANRREAAASISNVTNNNNCGNITINLPPMNSFDSTNIDYITTKLLLKELQNHKALDNNGINGIVDSFTKLIHANPAHPENHNVMFKSLNSGFARIYNGQEFEDRQSTEVQDKIIQQVGTLFTSKVLDEHNYEAKDKMTDVLGELENEWEDRTEDLKNKDNTRALSQCRNTVKAALHSKKDEIEVTHQLIEQ